MTQPIGIQVTADTSQGVSALTQFARTAILTKQNVEQLDAAVNAAAQSKITDAKAAGQALTAYNKLLAVSKNYSQAALAAAAADEKGGRAALSLVAGLDQLQSALANVTKTKKADADAQQRTLTLYGQMINLSQQAANVRLTEARAEQTLTKARAQTYQTQMRQQADARRAAAPVEQGPSGSVASTKAQDTATKELERSLNSLNKAQASLVATEARYNSKAVGDAQQRIALAQAEVDRNQRLIDVLETRYQSERRTAQVMTAGVLSAGVNASTDDVRATAEANRRAAATATDLNTAQRNLTSANSELQRATAAATNETTKQSTAQGDLEHHLQGTRYAMYQVSASYATAAAGLLVLIQQSVKFGSEYQAAFAQVQRATGDTAAELQPLYNDLERLADVIPTSFTELAGVAQLGSQMGIASGDLDEFTDTVARFSATTNVATTDAATAFGRLSNLLKVPTNEFVNLGSAVSYLGVTSVATESEILKVATSIAATANTAGLSTQATLGLSSAFASLAISPELARSALTRLFVNLDKDIAAGGDAIKVWADSLGMTVGAFESLYKTDPDEFFQRLIAVFAQTVQSGGDITALMDSLGIKSVRDIQVFQRLAGSVGLVTQSIDNATVAYAQGNYLQQSSAVIFDTVAAKAQKLSNAYQNLVASIGQTSFIRGLVGGVLDTISKLLQWLDSLPAGVKVAIGTFTTFIGVIAAYRAAIALAIAGTLAFRYINNTSLSVTAINFKNLREQSRLAFGEMTSGAAASAGAVRSTTAATAGATAAVRAHTAAVEADTLAMRGQAAASTGAGAAGATAGAAGAAGAATGFLGKAGGFLKSLPGIATVASVVSILAGLAQQFIFTGNAAEDAAAQAHEYQQAIIDAGGGSSSLSAALRADQEALKDVSGEAKKVPGYYGDITTAVWRTGETTARVVKTFHNASGGARVLSSTNYDLVSALDAASLSQEAIRQKAEDTTKALQAQNVVLGANTVKWQEQALQAFLDQSGFDQANLTKLQQQFAQQGLSIGQVIADGIQQGISGNGAPNNDAVNKIIDQLTRQAADIQSKINAAVVAQGREQGMAGVGAAGGGFAIPGIVGGADFDALRQQEKEIQKNIDLITKFRDAVFGTNGAVQEAATKGNIWQQVLEELGIDVPDATDKVDDLQASTDDLAKTTTDAASAFQEMLGIMTDIGNKGADVADAYDKLGQSLAENGGDFSMLTEAGRANLSALQDVVDAYGQYLAAQIQQGQMTAEQAAAQMQSYMISLVQQLGQVGVPTDQLDFLVNYLNQIVQKGWTVGVGADVTQAVSGIESVSQLLATVSQQAAVLNNGVTTYLDTSTAAGVRAASQGTITTVGEAFAPVSYQGPTLFSAGGTGALGEILKNSLAQKQLEQQIDKVNDAAKGAGKAQKDAADQASDALKQQQQYVKDLAGYYNDLGDKMFAGVNAQGKVFESLQKLGKGLVENGKAFNVVTDDGRANMNALQDVLSSYGSVLGQAVEEGTLNATQATAKFKSFASGVYGELLHLGVARKDIEGFFKGLGVQATGWGQTNEAVQQYGGFVTAASGAAKKAAEQADDTNDKLKDSAKALADYVQRISDAVDDVYNSMFKLPDAADAAASAFNSMQKSIQDNIDKIKELQEQNEELNRTISEQQIVANKAGIEYRLSVKYGETDRAKDYKQQQDAAQAQINDARKQIKANDEQAKSLQKSAHELKGNSDEAIANRKSISDLRNAMLDQIKAYAEQGHTQQEVARYADTLKSKFRDQLLQLGYTQDQVKDATRTFETYIGAIKRVPTTVKVTAEADTKDAINALNAVPSGKSYAIKSVINVDAYHHVLNVLKAIPKASDYKVSVKTSGISGPSGSGAQVSGLQRKLNALKPKNVPVSVTMNTTALTQQWDNFVANLRKTASIHGKIGGFVPINIPLNRGGMVAARTVIPASRRYAGGGLVPGTPPDDPRADNLLATGPGGLFAIRSREWVHPQEAVDYYGTSVMQAMNDRRIPRNRFMAGGGMVGGGANVGAGVGVPSGTPTDPVVVALAPDDRRSLRQIADKDTTVYVGDDQVARAAQRGGAGLARRGSG